MQRIWLWCLLGLSTTGCMAQVNDPSEELGEDEALGEQRDALQKGELADDLELVDEAEASADKGDLIGEADALAPVDGTTEALAPIGPWGGTWVGTGDIFDATPRDNARFGRTVAIENDRMVITRQQTTATDLATTQVYKRSGSGWALEFTWTTEAGRFATSRIRNDWLVIGEACGSIDNSCHGMVRIFKRWNTGWTFLMWINYNDQPQDYGRAVAFDGTNLAVATKTGVYAYVLSDPWFYNLLGVYPPPSDSPWGVPGFAFDVAIAGNRIAVSSPSGSRSTPAGTRYNPGQVYIYDTSTGTIVQTLSGEGVELSTNFGSTFGYSVSMSGTRLAVAAPFENSRQRTVYLFSNGASGYTLTHTLTQPVSPGYQTAVAIDGSRMLVTTSGSTNTNTLARIYTLGGFWGPQLAFEASLPTTWTQPAIHGKRAAVGQPLRGSWNRGRVSTWFFQEPVIFPGTFATAN